MAHAEQTQAAEGITVELFLTDEDLAALRDGDGGPMRFYVEPDRQSGESAVVEVVVWARAADADEE